MLNIIFILSMLMIGLVNYYLLRDFWCTDAYQ